MPLSTQSVQVWQGVNHIALVTLDLDATIHFYQDVLGLRLLANLPPNDLHGRHCVLWPGGSGLGLHFFELADAQIFTHPDALSSLCFVPGALQHISLTLPDAEAGRAMWERLNTLGIQTTEIMEQRPIYNFGFLDNNGIQVEVAWFKPGVAPPNLDAILEHEDRVGDEPSTFAHQSSSSLLKNAKSLLLLEHEMMDRCFLTFKSFVTLFVTIWDGYIL